jgi:hypothetical protein
MSDLRDRIAAAVYGGGWENAYPDDRNYWLTVADAVIGALGLKQQNRYGFHRCVSEWEPDD